MAGPSPTKGANPMKVMVTMYPLIEEFSDFGRNFSQNNE
jgi:hypothetical protein